MQCVVDADDTLLGVYYGGVDITAAVKPQFALPHLSVQKSFTFAFIPGAYLTIYAGNIQDQGGRGQRDAVSSPGT